MTREPSPEDFPDRVVTCSCGAYVKGRDWRKHAAEKHPDVKLPPPRREN